MSTTTTTTALELDDTTPGRLVVRAGDVDIATYVHDGDFAVSESRKPYLHPLRTLDGAVVTAYRPNDHRWHKGLQMTASHVSGQNFWGGGTYVHGEGYVPKDNVGQMRHDAFDAVEATGDAVTFTERLTWIASTGQEWAREVRTHSFGSVDTDRGTWTLDFSTEITNTRGEPLELGSPTTHGRPAAGYTGFFWRGPRGWTGGDITTPDRTGEDAMGTSSPWLAYSAVHDEVDGGGTLLVLAGSASTTSNPSVPLHWFVRHDPFPAIAPSFAFSDEVVLADGESLRLRHRVVVGDRVWDRDEIEAVAAANALDAPR
ncbi:DUF6807 domain-containing protein [Kineococcus arenarius]|uniref:DUF6807 domain-containing protein n=1 Tax=unclassified Kineococcus TaxID=2621656 RepID=UPI003D7E808D